MRRNRPASTIAAIIFLGLGTFVLFLEKDPGVKRLSVAQVSNLLARDTSVLLLDVRNADEWKSETGHLANAFLVPLPELQGRISDLEPYRKNLIVVYCRSGNRSGKGARLLIDHGFDAVNMVGGMRSWNSSGLPVTKEQSP